MGWQGSESYLELSQTYLRNVHDSGFSFFIRIIFKFVEKYFTQMFSFLVRIVSAVYGAVYPNISLMQNS